MWWRDESLRTSTTILHSEGGQALQEVFERTLTTNLGSRPRRAFGGRSLVRQLERKKEMRACPSDLEGFVQRTTLMKDWPVLNDQEGVISSKAFLANFLFADHKGVIASRRCSTYVRLNPFYARFIRWSRA
jgi:hypothetical protein